MLEAIADDSCFFWCINFGDPGSLNDTNALNNSSVVGASINGMLDLRTDPHMLHGVTRDWMHFLADGVCPNWAVFVKTVPQSAHSNTNAPEDCFSIGQEAIQNDFERAFGALVKKFHKLARPIRHWKEETIQNLLCACIIPHSMCCEERIKEMMCQMKVIMDIAMPLMLEMQIH